MTMLVSDRMPTEPVQYEQVYYVETMGSNDEYNPIAIKPRITGKKMIWNDTAHGVAIKVSKILLFNGKDTKDETPDTICIQTDHNIGLKLTKLTLEVYRDKVKDRVEGKIDFQTDEELKNFYLNANFTI